MALKGKIGGNTGFKCGIEKQDLHFEGYMTQDFIQLTFDRVVQTRAYTAIVLKSKEKRFAIFADAQVGKFLQLHLSGEERARPQTPDLISSLFSCLDIEVKQLLINDLQDTTFFARLFLEMQRDGLRHIVEIDARPSDCIILAFLHSAPVFCTRQVLEQAVPFVE